MFVPDGLPVLSGGSHEDPTKGACFMEYVSVLAGEPWSDTPKCVEHGLAMVMQNINDTATDENRHLLVPLLGQSIGLAPAPYKDLPLNLIWMKLMIEEQMKVQREHAADKQRYEEQSMVLRKRAWQRFAVKVSVPIPFNMDDGTNEPAGYFTRLTEAAARERGISSNRSNHAYIALMVEWARRLHEAYEEAMEDLGWSRKVYTQQCSVEDVTALLSYPELYDPEEKLFVFA
jgi:hypothetical protein